MPIFVTLRRPFVTVFGIYNVTRSTRVSLLRTQMPELRLRHPPVPLDIILLFLFILGHLLLGHLLSLLCSFYCACALLLPGAAPRMRWPDQSMWPISLWQLFPPLSIK